MPRAPSTSPLASTGLLLLVACALVVGAAAPAAGDAGVGSPYADSATVAPTSAAASTSAVASVSTVASTSTAASTGATATGATAAQSGPQLVETAEYRLLPDRPDRVEVEIRYRVPDGVESLSFELLHADHVDVVGTDGFDPVGDGRFQWDGRGDAASVTLRHDVDESFQPEDADDQYVGGTGEWAIVARPPTRTEWEADAAVGAPDYRLAVDGEGHAGERLAYLGPHTRHERTVAGERVTLVVPDAADLASSPTEILDAVGHAARRLRVGERSEEVTLLAAPTGDVEWSPPGLAMRSDARVVDRARVDAEPDVWTHEYVHTRQNRDVATTGSEAVAEDARWFVEGSADYYAALFALERGATDFPGFRTVLERGASGTDGVVLSEPPTWAGTDAHYEKGALVAGALDRRIRAASGGEHTLQDVLRAWNRDETFTGADLLRAAETYGNASTRAFLERHVETTATPETWDRDVHRDRFEADLPAFDYRVVSDPPVSVDGPHRSGPLPNRPVVGETVVSEVRVENVGDTTGSYRAVLSVGGEVGDEATGRLGPGEATTVELRHELARPGDHRLVVGDRADRLTVYEPAEPLVGEFTVEHGRPTVGRPTTVTATVVNPTNRPAAGEVELLVDGEREDAATVELGAGEETTVELTATFESTGEHAVAMGDGELVVEAREPLLDRVPGFGAGAALAALLAAVALLARRD